MKFLGHSPHQILVVFPVGLLVTAVVFDLVALGTGNGEFWTVSYWLIPAGLVGGAVAAVFGLLDWRNIPARTRANRIGILHGVGNAVVLGLFAFSWWLRDAPADPPAPIALYLSGFGVALILFTGWLGGELVSRLSVGVDRDAHVNASNSLKDHGVLEPTTSYKDAA